MSFKTIFQDTSSGNAIRQYFDAKFAAIESRLESIERMLGDQEEDCPVVDRQEAMDKLDELLSRPDPILETLWRPMSTAPSNGLIQAKIKSNGNIIKIVQKYGLWVEDDYYLYRPDVFEGWRPL